MAREAFPRSALRGLYVITQENPDTRALAAGVEACLAGGAALVQYRAKDAPPALALAQAERLAALCRARHTPFIVNDSLELALAVGADGVHLGLGDGDLRAARAALPKGLLGASCYADPQRARAAAAAGADYVALGSVFASSTKPAAARAPLACLAAAKAASGLPVVAIGGITLANAPLAITAGADMVAVISALFEAPDVQAAARAFARLFDGDSGPAHDVRTQPRPL